MNRAEVNADSNQTCSTGLHFCSLSYLSGYHGGEGVIIIVKVDPADVVSIPVEYRNTKGRCCRYTVIKVYRDEVDPSKELFDGPLYKEDGKTVVEKKAKVNFWNVRDARGHFVKREATRPVRKATVSAPVKKGKKVTKVEKTKKVQTNYHNKRGCDGRFIKKEALKNAPVYGRKPTGEKYWNMRDSKGHFLPRMKM